MVRREGRGLATRAFALLTTLRIFAWIVQVAQDGRLAPFLVFRRDGAWASEPANLVFIGLAGGALLHFLFAALSLLASDLGLKDRRRLATARVMTLPLAAFTTALFQHRLLPHAFEIPFPGTAPTSFAQLAGSLPFLGGFFAGGVVALASLVQLSARSTATMPGVRSVRSGADAIRRLAVSVPRRDPFASLLVLVGALAVAIAFVPPSPAHVQPFTVLDGIYLGGTLLALGRYLRGRRAVIGVDGLRLGSMPPRFVPFAAIDRAAMRDEGLELFHGVEPLARLELSPSDPGALQETQRRVELALAEREAGELARAALVLPGAGDGESPLSAHAYRHGQLSTEELWRLVEAGTTPAELRVRAATHLASTAASGASAGLPGASARAGEATRLRIAAETCLAPGVREALEALADEESSVVLSSRA